MMIGVLIARCVAISYLIFIVAVPVKTNIVADGNRDLRSLISLNLSLNPSPLIIGVNNNLRSFLL